MSRTRISGRCAFLLLAGAAALGCGDSRPASTTDEGALTDRAVDSAVLAGGAGGTTTPVLGDTALTSTAPPPVERRGGEGAVQTRTSDGTVAATPPDNTGPGAAAVESAPVVPSQPTPADVGPAPSGESTASTHAAAPTPRQAARSVPFAVGERFDYEVRFGPLKVGEARMEVIGVEDVRGRNAYHTRFRLKGGALGVSVDDRYDSWMDTETLASLRHVQDVDEAAYERQRSFEIFPDRQLYIEHVKGKQPSEPRPSVAQPLDEGSFVYFIRSLPELEVGKTYTFDNYFRPDRNPVRITVVRRERVEVPAGRFDALLIRPSIKTKGLFSEGGRAEIWLADDSTRALLQLKTKLSFGSVNLYLKSRRTP